MYKNKDMYEYFAKVYIKLIYIKIFRQFFFLYRLYVSDKPYITLNIYKFYGKYLVTYIDLFRHREGIENDTKIL